MSQFIVSVRDVMGNIVHTEVVDTNDAGSNAEDALSGTNPDYPEYANLTRQQAEVQLALFVAAPEVCPFDCDHCRA